MIRKQVSVLQVLGLSVAGCSKDSDGELITPDLVAGLRYVNVVPDTGAMDIRVIDIVGNAPNTVNATFRTSGQPFGITTTSLPLHTAVLAGSRQIRAFMTGTTIAIASTVMLDTTVTFEAGKNYTVYLWGYARTGSTPALKAMVVTDSVPTIAASKIAVRVLNLAPTYAGAAAGAPAAGAALDFRVAAVTAAPTGAALFGGQTVGAFSAYNTSLDSSGTTVPYRLYVTAPGAAAPAMLNVPLPLGSRGTSTTNPIAGTAVAGSAITAIIVPQSVALSPAPQGGQPAAVTAGIDSVTRNVDTVTVWRSITPGNGTSTCNTAVAAGVAVNDVITITGLTQPEYNGAHVVMVVVAGTSQTVVAAPFSCTGVATPSRFRFRIASTTAVTPATGATSYSVATAGTDFTAPWVLFITDQRPPRTAP
jgi:hypothetical protein